MRELATETRFELRAPEGGSDINRNLIFSAMGLSALVGFSVAAYLTFLSFSPPTSCPVGDFSIFSCNEVLWSKYSHLYGVSVALLGMIWFIIVTGLIGLAWKDRRFVRILVAWSLLGAIGVSGFVYTEVFLLGAICPLCTITHIFGLAILAFSAFALRSSS